MTYGYGLLVAIVAQGVERKQVLPNHRSYPLYTSSQYVCVGLQCLVLTVALQRLEEPFIVVLLLLGH